MRKIKVGKAEEVINYKGQHYQKLEEKIKLAVKDVLLGLKESLSEELEGIGLLAMEAIMEEEVEALVGERHKHNPERQYTRGGTNPGSVVLNGKKVARKIQRVVEKESKKAWSFKSYALFHKPGELIERAYRDLIRGISTRHYEEGVSKFIDGYGMSSSSVSRRMIEATTAEFQLRRVHPISVNSLAHRSNFSYINFLVGSF